MKNILITPKRQKRELLYAFICFLLANGLNIYAISSYAKTSWSELYTQLPYVLIITFLLYCAFSFLRVGLSIIRSLLGKKSPDEPSSNT